MYADSVLKIIGSALSLWESKEKRKYLDELMELKEKYYREENKPNPDYAVLDNIDFKLHLLSEAVSSSIEKQNFKDKQR